MRQRYIQTGGGSSLDAPAPGYSEKIVDPRASLVHGNGGSAPP